MQTRSRHLIILTAIFLLALGLIYLLSNKKFMFTDQSNKVSSCETNAEKQAREDLKQKYGDALSRDFVLGSPHYKNRLDQCLSEK